MVIFSRCTILVQQWKVNGQWQKTIIKNSHVMNIQKRGKILKCIYIFRESKLHRFALKWVDILRLNAFGSLIDFMSLGGGGRGVKTPPNL